MPARLTLFLADRPARVYTLREGADHLVGRDAECAVRIDDERASRRHALLHATEGEWKLADLRSKNGTQLDGSAVRGAPRPLLETSWISFGGVLARFEQLTEEAAARQQDEQLRRWQSSVEMQRRLTPSIGLAPLLERLLDSVLQLSRTDRALVLLSEPDGGLVLAASRGLPAGTVLAEEFGGSVGAVQLALQEGRPVATSDAQLDSRLAHRPSIAEHQIRALVAVPLVAAERLVGALYADSSRAGAELTELDVDILCGLASHAALAITVARLDVELARMAADLPAGSVSSTHAPLAAAPAPIVREENGHERSATTAALPADDTGLRWDELVLAHRGREGAAR
ncbi:MAG TPA: GAF domain-containing protein [Thermoanaerobaculia bacterium]|nr:GAF domain-containing protein [Thermoanaerobaculia bacterium]